MSKHLNEEEQYLRKCAYSLVHYCENHHCSDCMFLTDKNQCAINNLDNTRVEAWQYELNKLFNK